MGRRTTSTTKGGRYMNPADQERKMARKKELKKNKKQRSMVRQAVLKSKDASDLLTQMEKLDEMEFSDFDDRPLSERVIQEKRNKLRETFLRVLGMYRRENEMEKFGDMRKQLQAYDQKRLQLEQQFIAQKFAREVNPADIPLPDSAPPPPEAGAAMTPAAALANRAIAAQSLQQFSSHLIMPEFGSLRPPFMPGFDFGSSVPIAGNFGATSEPLHGILKKSKKRSGHPPGPPVGLPPELSDSSDEEEYRSRVARNERSSRAAAERRRKNSEGEQSDDERSEEDEDGSRHRRNTDESAGAEIEDSYDDEGYLISSKPRVRFDDGAVDESGEKDSRSRYKELAKMIERGEIPSQAAYDAVEMDPMESTFGSRQGAAIPPPPSLTVIGAPPQLIRPPVPLGLGNLRPGMRMPPPPPPGVPPGRSQRPFVGHVPGVTGAPVGAVLAAPPTVTKSKQPIPGAVIEAKPQLRNMQQEVTRLVPTAVKIRRDHNVATAPKPKGPLIFRTPDAKVSVPGSSVQHAPQKSTDEAYDEFMKEMQSFL